MRKLKYIIAIILVFSLVSISYAAASCTCDSCRNGGPCSSACTCTCKKCRPDLYPDALPEDYIPDMPSSPLNPSAPSGNGFVNINFYHNASDDTTIRRITKEMQERTEIDKKDIYYME